MPIILRRVDPAPRRVEAFELISGDSIIPVGLRRVVGAKRFTLRVRSATRDVMLTMPQRASIASAREFAQRHVAWIEARVGRLPKPVRFEPGAVVPVRGAGHLIAHRPEQRGAVWIETGTDELAPPTLCVAGGGEHVARRVRDFLRKEAVRELRVAVKAHATAIGVTVLSVGVRDTTSRWGSCSAAGALNFSWRLIMAPPFVLNYLAAHEVAHRVHLNHSPRFWALTRRLAPDTDRAEAWLKAHGADLHRYGAD
jgi:predicted metal-dependent hydrolase